MIRAAIETQEPIRYRVRIQLSSNHDIIINGLDKADADELALLINQAPSPWNGNADSVIELRKLNAQMAEELLLLRGSFPAPEHEHLYD